MDINMSATFLVMLLVVIAANLLLRQCFEVTQDAKEPPFLPQRFPYVDHIIGIMRHKTAYYLKLTCFSPTLLFSISPQQHSLTVAWAEQIVNFQYTASHCPEAECVANRLRFGCES
jgi:hypothetical protein